MLVQLEKGTARCRGNNGKYLLILVIAFGTVSCNQSPGTINSALSRNLDSLFRTVPDFSGVVLIAENNHPVYHKSFGYKNFNTKEALDTTSIFELASLSKQFTAMIIMKLKEDSLLQYDDTIEKYIPGLPYPGITIRHLLNHTSGLPDYQDIMDRHWDKKNVAGNNDNIVYLKKYRPQSHFTPGEKFDYSNTGYMLLATIAETVSKKDFALLSRELIFQPLKMKETDIRTKENKVQITNMAWGHIYVPLQQQYVPADSFPSFNYSIWLGNRMGPGRVSSTASDLLKWDNALYTGILVKNETLREAFTPARLNDGTLSNYGFAWRIAEHPTLGKKIFHAGDNPGYRTIICRYTDSKKTLIILCNNAHEKFDEIVLKIENEM
jgi:CubicO group peptidase (beta-lactamase class C family)